MIKHRYINTVLNHCKSYSDIHKLHKTGRMISKVINMYRKDCNYKTSFFFLK